MSALKLCPTCGTEYPANERFCPRDGTALRSQSGTNDLVGSVIAERYHVTKKLGEGGMGQVYLAEHVKMGRKSAVKVMNPGMVNDADAISRFNREAANASRINHPNVAGIYDFGETPEGIIYLAMEFIEGESLTSVVEANGALAPIRAARITKQTADGLAAAHDLGIVHRDLKPDNIMIAKNRDGSDCVKVVDFGIAKAAGSEAQNVTRTGMIVGTPEYMSPEQLSGDKLDGRSDIYSLALVTFNMLTGRLPFAAETVQESMIMRLTDEPQPLARVRPDISWSDEVQVVMSRALQRYAKDRYQSASEFGNALFEAVDRMPKNAVASEGTLVLDANALPQTRLAPAAAGGGSTKAMSPASVPPAKAAPAAVPAKSRTPALVGGGVLVAAALAGAFFVLSPGKGASATPAGAVPAPAETPVAPPSSPASLGTTGGAGTTTPPVSSAPARPAPAVPSTAKAPGPTGTDDAPAPADLGPRIQRLLDESALEAKAGEALATATSLIPRATRNRDLVGLGLVRAQAMGVLGRDAESCTVLRSISGSADGTPYAGQIANLLKLSC